MSVVVSFEDVGPCRKQLKVEVPAPAVEAETQRVVRDYGQKVRLPGFRQGKVPAELVRRRFAKEIDQEVKERLAPPLLAAGAGRELASSPCCPPRSTRSRTRARRAADLHRHRRDPAGDRAADIERFDLPDPEVDPGTMEIEETIENIRKQMSDWVTVDRPASRGDQVEPRGHTARLPRAPGGAYRRRSRSRSATPRSGRR